MLIILPFPFSLCSFLGSVFEQALSSTTSRHRDARFHLLPSIMRYPAMIPVALTPYKPAQHNALSM